jgi:hypothetical protein
MDGHIQGNTRKTGINIIKSQKSIKDVEKFIHVNRSLGKKIILYKLRHKKLHEIAHHYYKDKSEYGHILRNAMRDALLEYACVALSFMDIKE